MPSEVAYVCMNHNGHVPTPAPSVPKSYCSRVADALRALGVAHLHLASTKDVEEAARRVHLKQTLINFQAAAECFALTSREVALGAAAGAKGVDDVLLRAATAFTSALEAEIEAGALSAAYPPGITTSVVATSAGGGLGAGGGGSAEPDIRVFRSLLTQFDAAAAAPATDSSASSVSGAVAALRSKLEVQCDTIDALLQRVSLTREPLLRCPNLPTVSHCGEMHLICRAFCDLLAPQPSQMYDITVDLGVSVDKVVADVASMRGSNGAGVTTIGFGPSNAAGGDAGSGFAAPSLTGGAADAVPAATLVARRRTAAVDAAPATVPSAGQKRPREESANDAVAADDPTPSGDQHPEAKVARDA